MADSFSKKENFKKKVQKAKEKALKREERKTSNNKGKALDEMFMYVDANGQLTTTPPDNSNVEEFDINNIQLGAAPIEAEEIRKTGIITFFSEKGYGFITEDKSKENVFFHSNNCTELVKKGNKVSFEKERSPKGFSAVDIKLVR
ncbi:cold shock CspA family protein [Chryseobacterium ginsenosidimutans]|jgi:cold shock CspA family protein|uniref:cold shock domain-containing protein n=1 Tax=Chryseobacterium ginsenosidimutans TaxID=687846 RepID=UPI002167A5F9|nr:cold shock domain-containing protein [Chryseobacterium ginsenosidimutans]MCS3868790.1 cold shock CspA family protein [Chryseobacterium ginsenosidimutans]